MSSNSRVAVMNQVCGESTDNNSKVSQTALAHAVVDAIAGNVSPAATRSAKRRQTDSVAATVRLEEPSVKGLLVLRAGAGTEALSAALQTLLGLSLPERLSSTETATVCVRWMSPDEWMLSCPLQDCFSIEQALRTAVVGDDANKPKAHIAIVNVSGGYSVLKLTGLDATNVLKKSMAYDIHPVNFPEGKVVNTTLAKSQVTMRALPNAEYELIVRRSFADYVWLWLQRAGAEYGLGAVLADGQ